MNVPDPDNNPTGPPSLARIVKTRKAWIFGIVLLVLMLLYTVAGFILLPYYGKKAATERLSGQLGRTVRIGSLAFNPYSLIATIRDFEIREADGSAAFVSFSSLSVNLSALSLFKGGPVIQEIRLERPHVHLVRTAANTYNFSALLDTFQKKPEAAPEKPAKPVVFSVSNIQVVDGDIGFDDRPVAKKHEITGINLSLPFISNLPSYLEAFVQPSLDAVINGTPLNIRGASKVFSNSRETSVNILLKGIDIPTYADYAPLKLDVKVTSGKLDVEMKVAYREYADRAPMLALQGETRIRDLIIGAREVTEGDILKVPLLSIQDVSLDLETRKIDISAVATRQGWVAVSRSAKGRMNFDSFMPAPRTPSQPVPTAPPAAPAGKPWTIALKSIVVDEYTVEASDHGLAEPFVLILDRINCAVQNLSTEKNAKAGVALSLRLNHTGSASIEGGVSLSPPAADLAVRLDDVRLKLLQPFLAGRAQVLLADGKLNMDGTLTASRAENDELNALIRGNVRITKFALLDAAHAEDLLKWDSLSLREIEVRYAPLSLHLREIALRKFYSRIMINADKTVNLREAFHPPASAGTPTVNQEPPREKTARAEAGQARTQPTQVRIDTITLRKGTINFTDHSIKPRFSSNLFEINGRISGLSSEKDRFGEVDLTGKYDRHAPLRVTGRVNPLRGDLFVALKADFKDMDLTSVSPYSGRYAGYAIQKGKLSFHLDYQIDKNKLDARNNVFIDQFTFGDAVESPDATALPVRLAVSLLKDRKGEIRLDIPVSGELNDPTFSVWRIVLKVIVNLLEKAATSPFALLGALFGGGDQLSYVEFSDGIATLTDDAIKKLDTLEKALNERPALNMDVIGHVDPVLDREGLKQYLMGRKIKAQKIKELAGKNTDLSSFETVTVTPEEYPLFLRRAYKEEKFPKPRNFLGMARDLPVPEMEKLMTANVQVTDEDLKALAVERVQAVRDRLLQSKQIDPERIFIVEAGTLDAEKKEGVRNSRVDFKLK